MAGKHWSLDNDEEDGYEVNHDSNENKANNQNDEIDPLDAFMENVTQEVQQLLYEDSMKPKQNKKLKDRDEDEEFVPEKSKYEIEEELFNMRRLQKKDVIAVDHNQIEYEPFRKNFYIETAEIAAMDDDDVSILREQMDGIKVKGVKCPKPIKKWSQCGLNLKILNVIKKLEYEKPTPIQAQAIPAIMSGRDVIGVAKTGSGKTISFLLPMFRHILDQRSLRPTEGPIAMILTPTRELAAQIYTECRRFGKILGIRSVCAYGGAPIKENISEMKRGTEIIVCTPGRMIDLLTANNGKVTNLRRVTYVVLDEADRMFDLGFEPQVMKIVTNVRPDSQNVMFSATFPRQMEALARSILKNPVEIVVGGRSIVCNDVTQYIEVVDEDQRFNRLLMILGEWQDVTGRVLIFVDTQDRADTLLRDLMKKGYPCMSLHAGKDQLDRVSIITDFKSGICNLLIATSVAARGLDVKELNLVINFDCPNHYEDYIHRVGRTGRAGRKGTAFTFITPDQEKYAPDLVKALKLSNTPVSDELQKLADEFKEQVKKGNAEFSGRGFGGKGLERMDQEREQMKRTQILAYGEEGDDSDEEMVEMDGDVKVVSRTTGQVVDYRKGKKETEDETEDFSEAIQKSREVINRINQRIKEYLTQTHGRDVAEEMLTAKEEQRKYICEFDINDYPQYSRMKITSRDSLAVLFDTCRATVTARGSYVPPGRQPKHGDRRLHLYIESDSEYNLTRARSEIKRILNEAALEAIEMGNIESVGGGKYSVL